MDTAAVEPCPYCGTSNEYKNWDTETQGYIAVCETCGNKIFLCDECMHADDNIEKKCNWHIQNGMSICMRGSFEEPILTT